MDWTECENQTDLVLEILRRHGMRISEVLTLAHERILGDTVVFRGLKGSYDRYVRDASLVSAIHRICGKFNSGIVFSIRYHHIYKQLKKLSIGRNGNQKARITSKFRLDYVQALAREGKSVKEIQNHIGHKRKSTTEYYIAQK